MGRVSPWPVSCCEHPAILASKGCFHRVVGFPKKALIHSRVAFGVAHEDPKGHTKGITRSASFC